MDEGLNSTADTGSAQQYIYEPLDLKRNEIRVLQLLEPSKVGELINCTLSKVSLDLNHDYDALSYTWGDQAKDVHLSHSILLDGNVFPITRNLERALQTLLWGNKSKSLWVDAISINQIDISERNEQVQKMKFVYKCAKSVLSWLGEEYENSREAFESLQVILKVGVKRFVHNDPEEWTIHTTISDEIVRKTLAIINLFSREYWWRSWIIQEVTFARRLTFYCGPDSIGWEDLSNATRALCEDGNWLDYAFNATNIAHLMHKLGESGPRWIERSGYSIKDQDTAGKAGEGHNSSETNESHVELGKLLIFHRKKRATDPRDKIYSLLSFISKAKQNLLPVDYGMDAQTVYLQVATFIVTVERSLAVLTENKQRQEVAEKEAGFHLPSWVPYWASERESDNPRIDSSSYCSVSGLTIVDACIKDETILCVKGIHLGTVTETSLLFPDFGDEKPPFAPAFDALYGWWLLFVSARKPLLIGPDGFLNFIYLGVLKYGHSQKPGPVRNFVAEVETSVPYYLRIVLSIYMPDDESFTPLIGKQVEPVDSTLAQKAEHEIWSIAPQAKKRKAFMLGGKNIGLGPQDVRKGDEVVALFGCKVPVVLRKRVDGEGWINIGDAYVDGFADGEAIKELQESTRVAEVFEIH